MKSIPLPNPSRRLGAPSNWNHETSLPNPSRRLGAPSNWNHETDGICHTLDIWDHDGAMISGWQPSPAELAKLNAGEPLFLHIMGTVHPVIGFSVGFAKQEAPPQTRCSVCGYKQFDTPSGVTCPNGHGGADPAS